MGSSSVQGEVVAVVVIWVEELLWVVVGLWGREVQDSK